MVAIRDGEGLEDWEMPWVEQEGRIEDRRMVARHDLCMVMHVWEYHSEFH
jgi:hypothetical protein